MTKKLLVSSVLIVVTAAAAGAAEVRPHGAASRFGIRSEGFTVSLTVCPKPGITTQTDGRPIDPTVLAACGSRRLASAPNAPPPSAPRRSIGPRP